MNARREDIMSRLETAIEHWNNQVADAHLGLSGQIERIQGRLEHHRLSRVSEEERAQWARVQAEAEGLAQQLHQRDNDLVQTEAALAQLREQAAALRRQVEEAEEQQDRLVEEMARLKAQLDGIQADRDRLLAENEEVRDGAQQAIILETLLQEERNRAELLEQQLRDRRQEAALQAMGERLTEALRDRDEAHREIVSLRSDIELLRRANAALTVPLPSTDNSGPDPVSIFDETGRRLRLGEILVQLNLIDPDQLALALREQNANPQRKLGTILIESGRVSEEKIFQTLARQLELPFVRLAAQLVDEGAARLVTAQLARRRMCLPIAVSTGRVTIAMANPFDLVAMDEIEMATGRHAEAVVAAPTDVAAALVRYYGTV